MATEGFFGEAGKNTYTIPEVNGFFSNVVNKQTGVTQLYKQGSALTQQPVGTYNPATKKFTPFANTPVSQSDLQKISSQKGLTTINTQSTTVVTKELQQQGTNPQSAQSQANQLLSGNKASTTNKEQLTGRDILNTIKENPTTRNSFKGGGILVYPLGMKYEQQDIIKFKMVKYEPRNFSETNLSFGQRSETRNIIGTTVLPVPAGISDTNAVSWASDNMNALQIAASAAAMGFITEGGEGGKASLEKTIGGISGASEEVKAAIVKAFTEQAVGVSGIFARTTGTIINPNMELLFNSPTLRPFSFTFKLSARSKREAERIRSIIRFFKQGMSPIRTESNLFLKAPHTFLIGYEHRGNPHPYLNKFKECALQSFNVDYTPEGQYATFTDGAMVSYQITMQFQELEPVFNDDYGNQNDAYPDPNIGF